MSTTKTTTLAAATLILTAALMPAVHAADASAPSVAIRYDAARVATDAGARDLYRRIAIAAERVCPVAVNSDLASARNARQCQADAVSRAVGQVHDQRLVEVATHARHG